MRMLAYNWQVRDEWFEICRTLPSEELLKPRTGGLRSVLKTLFHIVDVEYSWLQGMQGKQVEDPIYEEYGTLERIEGLSKQYRQELKTFVEHGNEDFDRVEASVPWNENILTQGDILRHVIAPEIHHVGQLSV